MSGSREAERVRSGPLRLPRLYAILDREVLLRSGLDAVEAAGQLVDAGVMLVQYRDKTSAAGEVLAVAVRLRERLAGTGCRLLLNDRVDVARLAGCDGAHVGQTDLLPGDARRVLGPAALLGVSTHTVEQLRSADAEPVDYVAVGPVFATGSKADAEPVVGLEMVRRARQTTGKPLVAIGGITCETAASVIDAGADSVAVIGGLFAGGEGLGASARRFLRAVV